MKRLVLTGLAALAGAASLGATVPPASPDACFLTRDLRGHSVGPGGHTLYFDIKGVETYRVTTGDNCLSMVTMSDPIVIRDLGRGQICQPLDLEIIARGARCTISELTRLSPAERAALPKKLQP